MPYIPQNERTGLDNFIHSIADEIKNTDDPQKIEARFNYFLSKLIRMVYGEPRYTKINSVLGMLEAVKFEFYRMYGAPYEEEKRKEHGDIVI